MSRDRKFQPQAVEGLENRLVLHGASSSISVVTGALHGPIQGFASGQNPSITTLVNSTFSTFLQNYTQTRSVYFASIESHTAVSTDPAAFNQFTQQSVELLAQDLLNNFYQSAQSTKHQAHMIDPLAIITKKIDGTMSGATAATKNPFNVGTLGSALIQDTPAYNASQTAIALCSLAEDSAIEVARVSIINGLNAVNAQHSHH